MNKILMKRLKENEEKRYCIDRIKQREVSKGDIYIQSVRIANYLYRYGVKKGDRIGIILSQELGSDILSVYFACIWLGAISMPISYQYNTDEKKYLLHKCKPKHIITSAETKKELREDKGEKYDFISIEELVLSDCHKKPEFSVPELSGDDIICILFTAGTTGHGKGACLTVNTLITNSQVAGERFGYNSSTIFMFMSPLVHAYAIEHAVIMSVLFDFTIVLNRVFDIKLCSEFWDVAEKYKVTVVSAIPSMLASLLLFKTRFSHNIESIKYFLCASSVLLPTLRTEFEQTFGVPILEIYGSTEAGIMATQVPESSDMGWKPVGGTKIRIAEDGEILIHSKYLFKGYINDKDETLKSLFKDEEGNIWYRTGDIGVFDENGDLKLTDRKKDLIIKGGYNIAPSQIDRVLISHELVSDVITVGIPDEIYGEEIISAVCLTEEITDAEHILKEYCRLHLEEALCPKEIKIVDGIPKTGMGKPDRKLFRKMLS